MDEKTGKVVDVSVITFKNVVVESSKRNTSLGVYNILTKYLSLIIINYCSHSA